MMIWTYIKRCLYRDVPARVEKTLDDITEAEFLACIARWNEKGKGKWSYAPYTMPASVERAMQSKE